MASLVASVRQCRSIGRQPALADEWGAQEIYPGPDVSDDDLEEYVRRTVATYHHQVGTCRMGRDAEAVVDGRLRVRGIEGLRVIDASVMPRITTGQHERSRGPDRRAGGAVPDRGRRRALTETRRGVRMRHPNPLLCAGCQSAE